MKPKFRPFIYVRLPRGNYSLMPMTTYNVQFVMPVDNPVNKVSMSRRKGHMTFEVPLNHPDAHKMGLMDLIAAAELSGLLTVSPSLNNKRKIDKELSNKVKPEK